MPEMKDLRLEHFTPCLKDTFRLDAGDAGSLDLRLTEAQELPSAKRAEEGERRGFTITFQGPKQVRLGQGIYPLEHPDVGRQEIFLVPIAEDADGRYYEAVFT
jgi:hypothetical protein